MISEVKCYSSYTYAQEPRSFTWQGEEIKIREIENAWQEPGERLFKIITEQGKLFKLCYNDKLDRWSASEL
jgi:hypothetical protein